MCQVWQVDGLTLAANANINLPFTITKFTAIVDQIKMIFDSYVLEFNEEHGGEAHFGLQD